MNTPTWHFSIRPAVPEDCRATPADLTPFFKNPVSSSQHILRITGMLDHVVAHVIAYRIDVPVRPAQQSLHAVR
jgi:hypothetical protein